MEGAPIMGASIPAGRREMFLGWTTSRANYIYRDAATALRHTWPHRHTMRGRLVILANVQTMRDLVELRDDIRSVV